jgi:kynureninase
MPNHAPNLPSSGSSTPASSGALSHNPYSNDESFALAQDAADPLAPLRAEFHIPRAHAAWAGLPADLVRGDATAPSIYMTGNSLGAMPRKAREMLMHQLDDWAGLGVEGHLHGRDPWLPYHESLRAPLARLVGALEREVVAMNSLTVNLHVLMTSFYRPSPTRYKIMIEDAAFPSDSHAVQSQAYLHINDHGHNPAEAIVRLRPRAGESTLRTDDILAAIEREGPSLALVMLGGVNYLTGQWLDMRPITAAARACGAICGWDLAHAAGNVPMRLHDWGADFAAWCSYKYLNSGPGAIAGAFVHERHLARTDLPQFAGWWGNDPATRFAMGPDFVPVASADRWQLSNPPIFSMTPVKASLELFDRAGIDQLRAKSIRLTGYAEWLIDQINDQINANAPASNRIGILTPRDPDRRGCQLSLVLPGDARRAHDGLKARGVVCDFRSPNVVRVAPTPLYTSFHDVWRLGQALAEVVSTR